jgi:hypothetical protein
MCFVKKASDVRREGRIDEERSLTHTLHFDKRACVRFFDRGIRASRTA